ncbi:MAG: DNA polymerase/3'-5' exonuclease PolX, partial [Desulfurella sp.]
MSFDENEKIASIFETIADALEFLNENAFKIRAYRNAAESIRNLNESIVEIYSQSNPKKIEGVGKDLEQKIKEYIQT